MHNAVRKLVAMASLAVALSSTPALAQVWQASTDYSSTQGYRNWRYMFFKTSESIYGPLVYGYHVWTESWHGFDGLGDIGVDIYPYGIHPGGRGHEAARVWESPIAGTVRVTGTVAESDGSTRNPFFPADGVRATIWKNGERLFIADIEDSDFVGYSYDLSVDVLPGDWLIFRSQARSNSYYDSTYFDPRITVTSFAGSDGDADGLPDSGEAFFGTNPADPDSDDDGLLDGTEVDMGAGGGCPNPLDPDSDDDTLLDGYEVVTSGTSPCNGDTDGDGLLDNLDPTPLVPGAPSSWVEQRLRDDAAAVLAMELALFDAPNANAAAGRRSALSTGFTTAANHVDQASRSDAVSQLWTLSIRVDGDISPPDWLLPGAERNALWSEINLMIHYILLLP